MNFISKLFKKNVSEAEEAGKGSVEEFVSLIRVYYQAVMAVNLGITNLNMLADMALFKRMLKIPTQNNKLGVAEKSRVRKVLMEDYGLSEAFFKEIDSSVKKNCKNQNDIKTYFFMFQGFCNDLFNLLGNLMQWKFRFSMLVKKLLYNMTTKTVHDILTKSEWKDISVQKAAWSVRKYAEKLGYSEQWITDFVYNVVLLAKEDQKKELKKNKEGMTTELHPLGFFLPENTRLLMLGSFPPPKARWSMDFYYPNIQNDMWRILGLIFYGNKDAFLRDKKAFSEEKAKAFCREKGIGIGDTAMEVIRLKANASDKFLEVVRPIDPEKVLSQIPECVAIVVTGQKAMDTLLSVLPGTEEPKVGFSSEFSCMGRTMRLFRMPSSSRAYPRPLEEKAAIYRGMFETLGML